jgi:[citrate (pro-3S)-lyase] ligase
VTGIYNQIMKEELEAAGIRCTVIPRRSSSNGTAISASSVRELLKSGDFDILHQLVPDSTYAYFTSPEAEPVLSRIRACEEVRHY